MSTLTINTDSGHLTTKGSGKVTIKSSISIAGSGTSLPIECIADFNTIPVHLHQVYFDAFRYQYGTNSNVYSNLGEEPKTIEEKKREWRLNRLTQIFSSILKPKG
jgi:hypothetical protein